MSKETIEENSHLNTEIKRIILDSLTKDYHLSPIEKAEQIYSDIELRFRKIFTSSVYASQFKGQAVAEDRAETAMCMELSEKSLSKEWENDPQIITKDIIKELENRIFELDKLGTVAILENKTLFEAAQKVVKAYNDKSPSAYNVLCDLERLLKNGANITQVKADGSEAEEFMDYCSDNNWKWYKPTQSFYRQNEYKKYSELFTLFKDDKK
jgi:hypothetical protein